MATTDILPFATGVGANVETQTAYAADSTTSLGFSAGTAASVKLNKVWRQSSFMAAGLANFMVNRGITVPDDGNLANLVAEFEASLDAYLSKNIAGGVSVTLDPILEANYPIINLTGALTANINLIVPTATGKWIIANNTTGAFSVTVKTAAGTGAVATQGTANQYYCDGTNVYSVIAGITQTQSDTRYSASMPNFTASTASNLVSASLGTGKVDFRNAALNSGTPVEYNIPSALSLVMNSNAISLGATTAVATSLIYAIVYNAGSPQLAVCNLTGGLQLDETNLITTTAIGSGSTAANVWYSTSAITTASQYRIVGRVDATWTSGTGWSNPTLVQPVGVGEALAGLSSLGYGQTWTDVKASRVVGTTYYNTTSKPISVQVVSAGSGSTTACTLTCNGLTLSNMNSSSSFSASAFGIIPPGGSYVYSGTATITWYELR
jgi:hypothetical protein